MTAVVMMTAMMLMTVIVYGYDEVAMERLHQQQLQQ